MGKNGSRETPDRNLAYRRKLEIRRRRAQRRRRQETVLWFLMLCLSVSAVLLIISNYREAAATKADRAELMMKGPLGTQETAASFMAVQTQGKNSEQKPDASFQLGSAGDVILHLPIIQAYGGMESGTHDFRPALETCRSLYESVDYMVMNLETSLGGGDKPYSGFPNFNAPDEIVSNLLDLGVDLQLLANNHIYDSGEKGFFRTMSVQQQKGAAYTGIRASESDRRYLIRDLNGICVGIVNYTYEMETDGGRKTLNGNVMSRNVENLLNSYKVSDLDSFYEELGRIQQEMYAQGAEFIIAYMHWGNEYQFEPNETQKSMAQRMCDMGIDVIIGGHPHVIQPMDVLVSADGSHKTFCAYSLGNHFTNQRRERISSRPNGHTEDGLAVKLTISRINGIVSVSNIEAIPTYVYKNNIPHYYVIPIYNVADVEEQTGLQGIQPVIQASYDRTAKILGDCVEEAKRKLSIPME